MKKVTLLCSVLLFSASAFALNAVAPVDEDCQTKKAQFEASVAAQSNNYFIIQNILLNFSDPMENLTDEQAQPLAECYATYQIKGKSFVEFVRAHQGAFRPKEAVQLSAFANRVERLSQKATFEQLAAQETDYNIMSYIIENMIVPTWSLSDQEATARAQGYKNYKVKNMPLSEFVRQQAASFDMSVEIKLEVFADRVESK